MRIQSRIQACPECGSDNVSVVKIADDVHENYIDTYFCRVCGAEWRTESDTSQQISSLTTMCINCT